MAPSDWFVSVQETLTALYFVYLADLLGAGVEVDGVVVPLDEVVPPRLNVRYLHGVTDGLHVAGCRP
jgi:hypothetical protein